MKTFKGMARLRLEIKDERGGAHNIKEFAFKDEQKLKFYNAVKNLPKVTLKKREGVKTEISFWDYALGKLIEDEFDSLTISQLRKHSVINNISDYPFNKAVKAWRKYLYDENWNEMRKEDTPRAFEFLHALELLDYPKNYTYSSLDTYYYRGKSLQKKSDFQS